MQKRLFFSSFFCVISTILVLGLGGCQRGTSGSSSPIERTDFILNTFVSIKAYDCSDPSVLDGAIALCKEYESRFSRTIETSEIYQLNHRSPEEQTFQLSAETAELLDIALRCCEQSDGAFDITLEPLSRLWDFTGDSPAVPNPAQIEEAVAVCGYENLHLDGTTLTFLSPDTTIDLGGIAKGYIADRLKEYLTEAGIQSAIINLGGNVLCIGSRPDGTPFRIGLQKPFAKRSETFETTAIRDLSVVTSGIYERYFTIDDRIYHHILDPDTGYPRESGLISVTILSESSAEGDGLSTACFSLGLEKGMELIHSMEGVYACFIDENYDVHYSDGMETYLAKD